MSADFPLHLEVPKESIAKALRGLQPDELEWVLRLLALELIEKPYPKGRRFSRKRESRERLEDFAKQVQRWPEDW